MTGAGARRCPDSGAKDLIKESDVKGYTAWVTRNPVWVIIATLLVTAVAVLQASSIKIVIDTNKLMPQSNAYVSTSTDIEKIFGSKHVVVVGVHPKQGDIWQPYVLSKIQRMTRDFQQVPGVVKDNLMSLSARRAKGIAGDSDGLVVRPLMGRVPADELELRQLREAIQDNPVYRNTLVSDGGDLAAVIVEFADEPAGFQTIMDKVNAVVNAQRDDSVEIYVGGLPNYISKIETYSERMALFFPLAILVLSGVLYAAFRTVQGMLLPLVTALLAVVWGVGVMGAAGIPMDAFNATTPILILAVATGHAVQLLKRYYEEYEALLGQGDLPPREANRQAVINSLASVGPVMIAAGGVAALGFFSLVVFEISSVRTFGIFTGIGILAALILELTFIPALRSILPAAKRRKGRDFGSGLWGWVIRRIDAGVNSAKGRRSIYAGTLVIMAAAAVGTTLIVEDNSVKRYFAATESFQRDDQELNKRLGGTNTVYLLIEGRSADAIKDPAVLKAMSDMQAYLSKEPGVGKTLSLADFIRRMNRAMHGDDPAYDTIPDDRELISQYLLLYSMSGEAGDFDSYVDYDYRRAKLTAYIKTDSTAYAAQLIEKIRERADNTFPAGVSVRIGGSVPQDQALNEAMVKEKLLNIAQIACVVLIVSSLLFRSVIAGLLVLAPLLLTVLFNFGLMGWSGILLNIPTSLTSAMAVGIGADYAIYLIFRLREELGREAGAEAAVRRVLTSAGEPILFVATAVAAGYGVLLLSEGFYIHMWLAILIISSMLMSALAALVLIPSLLLSLRPAFMFTAKFRMPAVRAAATGLGVAFLAAVSLAPDHARAADPDLVKLMERNQMVTKVPYSRAEATFTLINKNGQERVRRVQGLTRLDANGYDNQRVTRFLSPQDVKGTVSLLLEHSYKDDDMWIYLPALRKVRRLVSNNKKDSFVGTDFSYADVIGYRVPEWNYKLLREEVVDNQPCWVVEALPRSDEVKDSSGYSRRVVWIRKDNAMTVRSEHWDVNGEMLKLIAYKEILQVDKERDRWLAMLMEAFNLQTGHKTVIRFDRYVVDPVPAGAFTVEAMNRE
jgi:predicted RND superfamily exporter protein